MANVTISVPGEILEQARARALRLGTSVNAVLRDRLQEFAGGDSARRRALVELQELARKSKAGSRGKRWTRDELHER